MGFGTIIATIVSISLLMMATYLSAVSAIYAIDALSSALKHASEANSERMMTSIRIVNVSICDNNTTSTEIMLMLNNTGSTKIHDFSHMDVFIHYTANETGEELTKRLCYSSAGSADTLQYNEWTVLNIEPDACNPGIFDPDERMEIALKVHPQMNTRNGWIKIITPNGVSSFKYF